MKYLRRILIIFVLIVYNEFFNLFEIKDVYIGPLTMWDIVSVFALSYLFLEFFYNHTSYRNIENRKAIIWVNWLILFVFVVTLSMPFRGESLGNALLMSRKIIFPYLMLHLFVLDILKTKSSEFLEKILVYFSVVFSIVFILKVLNIDVFVHKLGFAYVTAAFIVVYWKDYFHYMEIKKIIIFLLFIGLFAQPFRAYAFATITLLVALTLLRARIKKVAKYFLSICILLLIAVPVSENFGKYSIINQVDSLTSDLLEGGEHSATGARLVKDMMYRIPMIEQSPYFGYGFVHPSSSYAKELGFYLEDKDGIDAFNLYSVDSGYLTFLTTFGFIGTTVILFMLLRITFLTFRSNAPIPYRYSFLTLMIVFIAATYTHHPLMTDFGIIPMMLILALTTTPIKNRNLKS